MVCPMQERRSTEQVTEYPSEFLYRPWSWLLSSFTNVLLIAFIIGMIYLLYRRRRKARQTVSFRRVGMEVCEGEQGRVNIVVTGSNGTLGRRLTRSLIEDGGYNVHCLDLWIPDENKRIPGVCSYIQADVISTDDLLLALSGVDAVFHVAGIIPMVTFSNSDYYRVNTEGTAAVIKACRECGVKRLIYTSSVSVVFSSSALALKDADESHPFPDKPHDAYAGSKGAAEKLVRTASGNDGLVTCALRPGALFDVGSPYALSFIQQRGGVIGDGKYRTSITFGDTTAQAHILAEKKLRAQDSIVAGKAYNICHSEKLTHYYVASHSAFGQPPPFSLYHWQLYLLALVNQLSYLVSGRAPLGKFLVTSIIDYMDRDIYFSPALAKKELGWEDSRPWGEVMEELVKTTRAEIEEKKTK